MKLSVRLLIWGVAIVIYAVFWVWYTPLEGALKPDEVRTFMERVGENGAAPDMRARLEKFFMEDDGRQFIMVNILDLADEPPALPATGPGATASDLLGHYMEHMYRELLSRASHPVFAGSSVSESLDLVGIDGAEIWQSAALMRYRSRRDLMEIVGHPSTVDRHAYKVAALDKTIAFPVRPQLFLSDLRLILGLAFVALAGLLDMIFVRRA